MLSKIKEGFFIPRNLLLLPLVVYFFLGLQHLTQFETADEHFWIYDPVKGRIHNYWDAIENGNWAATRINDKPGVTLAYIAGIGLLFQENPEERIVQREQYFRVYNPEKTEEINFLFRLPVLIFNGLSSLFFFWVLKRLTESDWLALIGATLILLNPVLLGISQIVNPDSVLWVFSTAAIFSFLTYLRTEEKKFAALTSIFLGLSLLSKYSAVILIPFFVLAIAYHILSEFKKREASGELKRLVLRLIAAYFLILFGAAAVFSLMMPAVFVDWSFLYRGTVGFKSTSPVWLFLVFLGGILLTLLDALFSESRYLGKILAKIDRLGRMLPRITFLMLGVVFLLVLFNWMTEYNFLQVKEVSFDVAREKSFKKLALYDKLFLEFRPLVFSLTPFVLLSIVAVWFRSAVVGSRFTSLVFMISAFMVSFYVGVLTQGLLVHIRYSIMLYPLAAVLAAVSMYELLSWERMNKNLRVIVFLGVVVASVVSLWLIKPFYFNYSNNLLHRQHIITGAWGYGGYEAAQFLNALPNAEELQVYTDYWGFCSFFKGVCIRTNEFKKIDKHISDIRSVAAENKLQEIGDDSATAEELAREAAMGTEEAAEVDNIEAGDPENNDPETVNASEINDFKIDYYVITRRGSISNKNLWSKLEKTVEKDPIWSLEIGGRPKNYVRIFEPDRNVFDLE